MTKYTEQINTGLSRIMQQCTAAQTVLSSCSEEERQSLYRIESQQFAEFLERLQDESLNGRNEALRKLAVAELGLFRMMRLDAISDIVPLLQSEGMDSKAAKEEAVSLCLEYLLETVDQSLRSAFLISYERGPYREKG